MKNNLITINFEKQGIRTITNDKGEILFVGKDVAVMLGYTNPGKAIRMHCKGGPIQTPITDRLGRAQQIRVITESDLYRLIANSKLPAAKKFEKWIFEEVLPQIRKTGGYCRPQSRSVATKVSDVDACKFMMGFDISKWTQDGIARYIMNREHELNQDATELKRRIHNLEYSVGELAKYKSRALAAESSNRLINITVIAKQLRTSSAALNRFLDNRDVIFKQNGTWLLCDQYKEDRIARLVTTTTTSSEGGSWTREHLKWTEIGRTFVIHLWRTWKVPGARQQDRLVGSGHERVQAVTA